MLQAENRMRAAKRHQGCLSGGETPQHGFMLRRFLGGGAAGPAVPHPHKGRAKEGTMASLAAREREVRYMRKMSEQASEAGGALQ